MRLALLESITAMKKQLSKYVSVNGDMISRQDFLANRNKSFTGKKVAKFNRIITIPTKFGNEVMKINVCVDKNNQIYDITSVGFGRLTALYYNIYGHPFSYDEVKEMLENM